MRCKPLTCAVLLSYCRVPEVGCLLWAENKHLGEAKFVHDCLLWYLYIDEQMINQPITEDIIGK